MKTDLRRPKGVMAELKWEPAVHATQIGVGMKKGTVTRAGEVNNSVEKGKAERAALRVHGVQGVAVEMKTALSTLGKRNDADMAETAPNAMAQSHTAVYGTRPPPSIS